MCYACFWSGIPGQDSPADTGDRHDYAQSLAPLVKLCLLASRKSFASSYTEAELLSFLA